MHDAAGNDEDISHQRGSFAGFRRPKQSEKVLITLPRRIGLGPFLHSERPLSHTLSDSKGAR